MTRRHLAKLWSEQSAGVVFSARLLNSINSFLLSVVLVRSFGLAAVGDFTIASVASAFIFIVGGAGLPAYLARAPLSPAQRNMVGMLTSLFLLPMALPLTVAYGMALRTNREEAMVIALFALAGAFLAAYNIVSALFILEKRTHLLAIVPVANLFGILVAAFAAQTLVGLATILVVFRLIGMVASFCCLRYEFVSIRALGGHLRTSAAFVPVNFVYFAGDELLVLGLSYALSRESLGLFGLCRQIANVGALPVASTVQAHYPALVDNPMDETSRLRAKVQKLSWIATVGLIGTSIPLGTLVYEVPTFPLLAAVMLLSLPFGGRTAVFDSGLRAAGLIGAINRIGVIRALTNIAALPIAYVFGLIGLLSWVVIHSALSAWLSERALRDWDDFGPTSRMDSGQH